MQIIRPPRGLIVDRDMRPPEQFLQADRRESGKAHAKLLVHNKVFSQFRNQFRKHHSQTQQLHRPANDLVQGKPITSCPDHQRQNADIARGMNRETAIARQKMPRLGSDPETDQRNLKSAHRFQTDRHGEKFCFEERRGSLLKNYALCSGSVPTASSHSGWHSKSETARANNASPIRKKILPELRANRRPVVRFPLTDFAGPGAKNIRTHTVR